MVNPGLVHQIHSIKYVYYVMYGIRFMTFKCHFWILFLSLCFSFALFSQPVEAQSFKGQFINTLDQKVDLSQWLSEVYGFVPLVTLVTEPAIGYGAGGGLFKSSKWSSDWQRAIFLQVPGTLSLRAKRPFWKTPSFLRISE
jgi:hypothetical protein